MNWITVVNSRTGRKCKIKINEEKDCLSFVRGKQIVGVIEKLGEVNLDSPYITFKYEGVKLNSCYTTFKYEGDKVKSIQEWLHGFHGVDVYNIGSVYGSRITQRVFI